MVVAVVVLWISTHFATQAFAAREQQLAQQWFQQGEAELRGGHADAAIADIGTALSYSQDNFLYRLRLAQALAAAGKIPQAQAYLLALWEEEPGNGTVNLELARLAVRAGQTAEVLRFFHGAIYGVWEDDPAQQRRQARFELVRFLLARRDRAQAESELIALAADLPSDASALNQVADLFSRTGNDRRALSEYQQALHIDPRNADSLAGAGRAAFSLGQYAEAERYLRRALAVDPKNTEAAAQMQTAGQVLQLDPYRPHLSATERSRRAIAAVQQVQTRLEQCATSRGEKPASSSDADLQSAYTQLRALRPKQRDSEFVDNVMDLVFRIEQQANQVCGQPSGGDLALLLIARQQSEAGGAPR